jgi:hypothetical protein
MGAKNVQIRHQLRTNIDKQSRIRNPNRRAQQEPYTELYERILRQRSAGRGYVTDFLKKSLEKEELVLRKWPKKAI